MLRCASSCFGLVRRGLVGSEFEDACYVSNGHTKTDAKTKYRWRCAVYRINSIINDLYEHWGGRTSLIYHALASKDPPDPQVWKRLSDNLTVKGYYIGKCSQMSGLKQQKIAALAIKELRNFNMPDFAEIQQTHTAASRVYYPNFALRVSAQSP